ncbi:MAG: hypothetical protein A2289_04470 [Deltaproteobacteria bacterium RIFOXYA12_FULL_58_15]|nr:MAG: hypothetical protein A2289_04470 [Deltaproteobacteria bacterium RIFOXYA12_FULL_58_15]
MSLMLMATGVVLGLLAWTLVEYLLHRLGGHWGKGRHEFAREHRRHHREPSYFSPASKKLKAAGPVLGVAWLAAFPVLGPWGATGFAVGVGVGWWIFETVHEMLHVRAPRTVYGRWARRHHLYHHFGDVRVNHGVTSPLWDWVFRTYVAPTVVRIPDKLAGEFPWLVNERGIIDDYSRDYEVRVSPGRAGQQRNLCSTP